MATEARWRAPARAAIQVALEGGRALGLEGKALEKHVSGAYPFGERAMYPYKIWLHEFDRLVRGRRRPFERRKPKAGPKLLGEWPGLTPAQRESFELDG
jgi:hypothetical protein